MFKSQILFTLCFLTSIISGSGRSLAADASTAYPTKPMRLIVTSAPGGAVDIVGRIVAQKLSEQTAQQVVVDNRAGAGGNLGAEIAAKAPPDGYTLLLGTSTHAINTVLYRGRNYDLVRDFAPISRVTIGQYVIVVHPSLPVKSVQELIALVRAKPGQLNYASGGTGNVTHLAGALFMGLTDLNVVHVPYKGSGPALTNLVGGQVELMFGNLTAALPHIRSGRLRALAVTGKERSLAAPELPTVTEAGLPGYVVIVWFGVLAPAATPREIVERLNRELVRAMSTADIRERLAGEGSTPATNTPEEFAALVRTEVAMWNKVIRDAKISAE